MGGTPVTIIDSGGKPVTDVGGAVPVTHTSIGAVPVTLADGGKPVTFVDDTLAKSSPLAHLVEGYNSKVVLEAKLLNSMWQESTQTTQVSATNDPVGYWADQSGNGNDVSQATPGARPLYKVVNGYPCVEADGSDDYLGPAVFTAAQPWWRISVIEQVTWSANRRVLGGGSLDNGLLIQSGSSPNLVTYSGSASDPIAPAISAKAIVIALANGASSSVQLNNGTAWIGDGGSSLPGGVTLFANRTGTLPSNIRLYALAMGTGVLPSNLAEIKTYLASAYGVSL